MAEKEQSEIELDEDAARVEGNAPPLNGEGNSAAAGVEDEVVVTIGEENPSEDQPAPDWVRELRKSHRELQREKRDLEERLKAATTKPDALGKKPALEDFDYDAAKFETAITAWHDQKRAADDKAAQERAQADAAAKAWSERIAEYGASKSALKVKDYEDSEATVQEALSQTQQGIILQGAKNPALVVYALGKNPAKIKEVSAITDPVKFAFAVAQLETQLKVTNKRTPPPPETTISGTVSKSGAVDGALERLRADAEKTGDYTNVLKYKRQKAAQKSA